jgi:hypothetical protein
LVVGSVNEGVTAGAPSPLSTAGAACSAAFFVVFLAAAFLVAALPSASPPDLAGVASGNAPFSFRTTGASMVDDADRTNSPISSSLAIATLLVIPSSLASS